MRVYQTLNFRAPKTDDGTQFDSILSALTATGYDSSNIQFCLLDTPVGLSKISSVGRVINAFPEMKRYSTVLEQPWGKKNRVGALTNAPELFARLNKWELVEAGSSNPIDPTILSEILRGIPKRFPFHNAKVSFSDVKALNLAKLPSAEIEFGVIGIMLESQWWTPKRIRSLDAVIALPVPDGDTIPMLPDATQKLLAALGGVVAKGFRVFPDDEETSRVARLNESAKRITEKYIADPLAGKADATLPCKLPVVEGRRSGVPLEARREAGIPSIKDLLKRELGPLGYRYASALSGQGGYTLHKRSRQNYLLEFLADASPRGGEFCSSLSVKTLFSSFHVAIQLPPHGKNYPIDANISDVIANTAYVVKLLENTYVRELEELFGPAPAWFGALRTKS